MKSAYTVLGIPGNASLADIEQAYQKASAHYSHARMAEDPGAVERLIEIKEAQKLLVNAALRAAHDRKLSAAVNRPASRARVVYETEAPPWYTKPLNVLALVVVLVFALGAYMSHSREQARQVHATQELAQKKLEADAAAKAEEQQARLDADRARAQAADQNREQQLRAQSSYLARSVTNSDMQQQAMAERQIQIDRQNAQQRESVARSEDRQRAAEAQRRVAQDQARIRELCMQKYRTPNC